MLIHGRPMRDAAHEPVSLRVALQLEVTELLAHALSAEWNDFDAGRLAGALRKLNGLPHSRGTGEALQYGLKAAHKRNRLLRRPCGCGKFRSCQLPGVSVTKLIAELARDPGLQISGWDIAVALEAVTPRKSAPRCAPADYDREGLEREILEVLRAAPDGLAAAAIQDKLTHPDATSHRIGGRLSSLKQRKRISDWAWRDGLFEQRVWQLVGDTTSTSD